MREWRLTPDDPLSLRLCADVRLGGTDFFDDHIWELSLQGGDPPAVALRTTYGLRARDMRVFPSFREGDSITADPKQFASPPLIHHFAVNRLQWSFEPLHGIQVHADYWVPDSHTVAGQYTVTNESTAARSIRLRLSAVLLPLEGGDIMAHSRVGAVHLLRGKTQNLNPVLMMEESVPADMGAWASLARPLDLAPGEAHTVRWVQAARPTLEEGIERCAALLERGWTADLRQIKLLTADIPDIQTGNTAWDAAFAFAYKVALAAYVGGAPSLQLPYPSFVFTRNINKGFSHRGDGTDHTWLWNGQVATEAYVNLPQVAQAAPELAKGIIRNYLAVQQPDGFIDWKPGLAGHRDKALCIPLLASTAWLVYDYTEDQDFIAEIYDGLTRFVMTWFRERYDRDRDGVPEWSHTIQSAFDDCPSFVRWQKWGQAADITLAESPDLASYLYKELQSLIKMAQLLKREIDMPPLMAHAEMIRIAVEGMWRDETCSYHYVDIESHQSPPGFHLGDITSTDEQTPLVFSVNRRFNPLSRVLVRVFGERVEQTPAVAVTIRGRGRRGRHRVEELPARRMSWYWGLGSLTSDKLYAEIDSVEVHGVPPGWQVRLGTVDYTRQDQTLLLPIWAGLPKDDRLERLVRRTITDPSRYWRPYGIPNCSALDPAFKPDNRDGSGGVWMTWNTMIGEGLADNGYGAEAADLITRLMTAMIHSLKTDKAFREAYNCDELEGLGERDYIWGVAPVHLFLRAVGIRILSASKVWLKGANPFPHAVTVQWRGVSVTKTGETSVVKFPSGKQVVVGDIDEQFVQDS